MDLQSNKEDNTTNNNASAAQLSKQKNKGKKRKRNSSETEMSNDEEKDQPVNSNNHDKTPNTLLIKNKATDKNMKHIKKKVAPNDQMLALVKLQEQGAKSSTAEGSLQPKITRSKAKELMKSSPQSLTWNIELTPIKHIPVKTRPEVKALIAQELPDESDEEYELTHDDVPSDDDHTLESCSDVDSQPRTPATPKCQMQLSPKVVTDGPFKVPPDIKTHVRRRLDIEEEEATIALRTRSKLSLSATPIEHIESSFIPPDELPLPAVDDLWNQFLEECLNPAPTTRNEDDDDADPEYNVAADPDAHDEDEEALENSIIKISKKELSDLVTELMNIMPDATSEESLMQKDEIDDSIEDVDQTKEVAAAPYITGKWEGKQEQQSDDDAHTQENDVTLICKRRDSRSRSFVSIGKSEAMSDCEYEYTITENPEEAQSVSVIQVQEGTETRQQIPRLSIQVEEGVPDAQVARAPAVPALLKDKFEKSMQTQYIEIHLNNDPNNVIVLPEQVLIFQQQLRMHIQLATSNFLQLYVHPVHWSYAPQYKEFLSCLEKLLLDNPKSLVNVCNLNPALELIRTWEVTVSEDTPENKQMIEHIQKQADKCRRRLNQNSLYIGEFHPTIQQVIANSSVFLYPYLLPSIPYRSDQNRRTIYVRSEDELIAIGLDQFWQYIEDNPDLYKRPARVHKHQRWGLSLVLQLINKNMFTWLPERMLRSHIQHVKKHGDADNPINKFFKNREITPVKHKLLAFNPKINLYEQPEYELPLIWLKYLSKTSKRAKSFIARRAKLGGIQPHGVVVDLGKSIETPSKTPLPIQFNQRIVKNRASVVNIAPKPATIQPVNIQIQPLVSDTTFNPEASRSSTPIADAKHVSQDKCNVGNLYSLVQTSDGAYLLPIKVVEQVTSTVNSVITPIVTAGTEDKATPDTIATKNIGQELVHIESAQKSNPVANTKELIKINKHKSSSINATVDHCKCCSLIRKICKQRQTSIKEFFTPANARREYVCPCRRKTIPKMTNKFKLFLDYYKKDTYTGLKDLCSIINLLENGGEKGNHDAVVSGETDKNVELKNVTDIRDFVFVIKYQLKLWTKISAARFTYLRRFHNLLRDFDVKLDCPLRLCREVEKLLSKDLPDMFKDFLALLTEEQIDNLHRYRDYFMDNCLGDLIKKIEVEVKDKVTRREIYLKIKNELTNREQSACSFCYEILPLLVDYPRLAQYFFNLFPHRHKNWKATSQESSKDDDKTTDCEQISERALEERSKRPVNYEADDSSSGEENDHESEIESNFGKIDIESVRKSNQEHDNPNEIENPDKNVINTPELTVSKTEVEMYNDSSDMSMMIMSEDDTVKSEAPEWSREEDKQILELLKESLPPEKTVDEPITDILEEKHIFEMLSASLLHKNIDDIKERVLYLLGILVFNGKR